MQLGRVAGPNDQLGLDTRDAGALYGHDSIIPRFQIILIFQDGNDGVRLYPGRDGQPRKSASEPIIRSHVVQAARHVVEPPQKDPIVVLGEEVASRVGERESWRGSTEPSTSPVNRSTIDWVSLPRTRGPSTVRAMARNPK